MKTCVCSKTKRCLLTTSRAGREGCWEILHESIIENECRLHFKYFQSPAALQHTFIPHLPVLHLIHTPKS